MAWRQSVPSQYLVIDMNGIRGTNENLHDVQVTTTQSRVGIIRGIRATGNLRFGRAAVNGSRASCLLNENHVTYVLV